MPSSASEIAPLIDAALSSNLPIDVTTSPGLWGGHLRGVESELTCVSSADYDRATDDRHAGDLIQAHLIETLSCVGRDYFDVYFLRVRRLPQEFQIAGALEALEMAKQEGHIRFLGIACDGPASAAHGLWSLHDAFDLILLPDGAYADLAPLARHRRVGVIRLSDIADLTLCDAEAAIMEVRTGAQVRSIQFTGAIT